MTRIDAGAPGHAQPAPTGDATGDPVDGTVEAVDEATVGRRLDERAEVLQRFAEGDVTALAELLEHVTGTPVTGHRVRYPERTAR